MKNKNLKKQFYFIASHLILIFAFAVSISAQTTEFTYQGKLTDTGTPSPNYDFEFRLCDSLAADCTVPIATQMIPNVPVSGGVFTVKLDFGPTNFDGSNRWLEITVKHPAQGTFTTLTPRQPLTSAPYSIKSLSATNADVALDANKLGGIDASEYVTTSSVGNSFIINTTTQQTGDFNISGNGIVGGRLGIGIAAPRSALDVTGAALISPGGSGGGTMLFSTSNSETAMSFVGGNNRADIRYDGTTLKLLANGGPLEPDSNYGININNLGNVGIGTTNPQSRLDVNGLALVTPFGPGSGGIQLGNPNSELGMSIVNGLLGRADVRYDGTTLKLVANSSVGGPPASTSGIAINNIGNVGIGTTTPAAGAKLDVNGQAIIRPGGSGGSIGFGNPNGETGLTINAVGTNRADIRFDNSTLKLVVAPPGGPPSSTNGIAINTSGNVGIGTTNPQAKLDVAGTTKTNILQITGGSDLAEHFEFAETVKPGMVVAIDSNNAGKLIIARGAYNRRVAGIISGANNLSAGMTLPDLKDAKNSMPVALSGRVWVYCDATRSPILPGDLLTTSATPGHAMKVVSYTKAQGAIIGKAMSGLKSGKGLVLVLVTLQ